MMMAMALLWSKALLAISAGFLAIIASIDIQLHPFRIRWLLTPKTVLHQIRTKPQIWVFSLFFLLYLIGVVYPGEISAWWTLTHVKIAFLIMPLSFAMLDPFTKKEYMMIVLSMVIMTIWSSIWVQVGYFENYYLFNESLGFGGSLPAPTNHIRYGVIVALSMLICLAFAIEDIRYKYPWERWLYGILAVYLFYFLHLLSVRSGLAIGYAGILLLCLLYIRHLRRWKQFAMLGILVLAPLLAYKVMPGFEQKINYSIYDFGKFNQGDGTEYSDSERWQSWRAGIVIGNQHPFFGTGPARFKDELQTYYQTEFKRESFSRPHNQFINVFTCFGLFGLTVFILTLIYPMTLSSFWNPPVIPVLFIMQLLSMFVEHPLDTTVGTSLFLLLTLLGLNYQHGLSLKPAVNDVNDP
jgi:O-antigen ligase